MVETLARAKVNLSLQVLHRRADGFHVLDSLVAFADFGDVMSVEPADEVTLSVTGPRAQGVPDDGRNLILQAAKFLDPGGQCGAKIALEKHLPAAAGIGGGSADAAAALRLLSQLWDLPIPDGIDALGADIPVCLSGKAARMRGIGEQIDPVKAFPNLPVVLVNPGVAVPTGAVFNQLPVRERSGMPAEFPSFDSFGTVLDFLARTRNDLEGPACDIAPVIRDCLHSLRGAGAAFARMSGSGATCFGLFATAASAVQAATQIAGDHPDWWVRAGQLS